MDLTKIEARIALRRPPATSPLTGGYRGGEDDRYLCAQPLHNEGALRASLVSLNRTYYQVGEMSKFEVTVENTGSGPISIPFSPHLAELQPKDPAQKFFYRKLEIFLYIAGKYWKANNNGSIVLYGGDDHPATMLSLQPGQWARIIIEGKFILPGDLRDADSIRSHPAHRVYAETSLYREETLITQTQSTTVEREICVAHTPGQSVPTELTVR